MKNICICVLYLLLTLTGMTLIKMGGQSLSHGIRISRFSISLMTLVGISLYGLSFLLYTFLISRMQISIVMPLLSAIHSCALVMVGVMIFHEVLNLGQMVGIAIVIVGVFVMGVLSK